MNRVYFQTFGCKLNQAETAMMRQDFLSMDYEEVQSADACTVAVINTCTVTGRSATKCKQLVNQIRKQNPDATIVLTGCFTQVAPEEASALEGVDYVLGVQEKLKLFEIFPGPGKLKSPNIKVNDVQQAKSFEVHDTGNFAKQTRAFLKIQNGCNRRCSYCIVPIARGPVRSLELNILRSQAEQLIQMGYQEIVLTGVHIGDYGKDHYESTQIVPLLHELLRVESTTRFRLSSLNPEDLTDELVQLIKTEDRICNHFHIPVQSGCDILLKEMNRTYSLQELQNKLDLIYNTFEKVGLGADIIVGFPGETEDQFTESVRFIEKNHFSYVHVFPFSPRNGTPAAERKDQIQPRIRMERARALREVVQKKKELFYKSWVGETVSVLFENKKTKGMMAGFSSEYVRVKVPFDNKFLNCIAPVTIIGYKENTAIGKLNI